jgi:hypothetical protein
MDKCEDFIEDHEFKLEKSDFGKISIKLYFKFNDKIKKYRYYTKTKESQLVASFYTFSQNEILNLWPNIMSFTNAIKNLGLQIRIKYDADDDYMGMYIEK